MAGIAKIASKDLDEVNKINSAVLIGLGTAAVGDVMDGETFYAGSTVLQTGNLATVALDPALNEYPAGYHAGEASLTAVDAQLVAANIANGIVIFGVTGNLSAAIVHDDMDGGTSDESQGAAFTIHQYYLTPGGSAESTVLVTKTLTCIDDTVIHAGVGGVGMGGGAGTSTLRLYIDGVQVAETAAFPSITEFYPEYLVGNRAVSSGDRIVLIRYYNGEVGAATIRGVWGMGAGCSKLG